MALEAFREHWLTGELFREPEGGRLGWGALALGAVFVAYQAIIGNLWTIPLIVFPVAEVFPERAAETAGLLRLVGLFYLCLLGLDMLIGSV